jgi:hypothetical protein
MKNINNILHWIQGAFSKAYDNDVNYHRNDYNRAGRLIINLPARMIFTSPSPAIPGKLSAKRDLAIGGLVSRACFRFAGWYNIQEMIILGKYHLRNLAYQNIKKPQVPNGPIVNKCKSNCLLVSIFSDRAGNSLI